RARITAETIGLPEVEQQRRIVLGFVGLFVLVCRLAELAEVVQRRALLVVLARQPRVVGAGRQRRRRADERENDEKTHAAPCITRRHRPAKVASNSYAPGCTRRANDESAARAQFPRAAPRRWCRPS